MKPFNSGYYYYHQKKKKTQKETNKKQKTNKQKHIKEYLVSMCKHWREPESSLGTLQLNLCFTWSLQQQEKRREGPES